MWARYFTSKYQHIDYDGDHYRKNAKTRRKYVACDHGTSGAFLVDRNTGEVYSIKAYGVPNRRLAHISAITTQYVRATVELRFIAGPGYVDSDAAFVRMREEGK